MAAEEEVQEHVHHAREPFDKLVAGSMAMIAALLAIVSVLGQHFNTEMLLDQQLASDEWAFYQAKDIRRYVALSTHDTLAALKAGSAEVPHYAAEEAKYRMQSTQLQEKAVEYEHERNRHRAVAGRFHFGEVFLEVAIVFSSLAILMKQKSLFMCGVVSALIGAVIAGTAIWA